MMKSKKMRDRRKEKEKTNHKNMADDGNDYRPQNTSFDALAI